MNKIKDCTEQIESISEKTGRKARERLDKLCKPKGSLGQLEKIAIKTACITGQITPPTRLKKIPIFAADHGVTEEGVSAYPQKVTHQMVLNFLRGGAGINVLADHAGVKEIVVDMGTASTDTYPGAINKKIGPGTRNITEGPAMDRKKAISSVEAGIQVVRDISKEGLDLLGVGDMGIGNTTPSSAITAVMTDHSPGEVTDRGTGISNDKFKKKIQTISKALTINEPDKEDPIDVLSKIGGFEIGGIAGCLLGGAALGKPILLDGFITTAAALIAVKIEPTLKDYLIASHLSNEQGHQLALRSLGISPLLELNLRLGEGTGACLAMGMVEASIKILDEMDTFEKAGVTKSQ